MNMEEARGRKKIIAIIATIILIALIVQFITLNTRGILEMIITGTRLILTAFLCYFLYQGKYLAKRITAVLTTLAAISSFLVAFMAFPAPRVSILMFLLFAIYGTISYQLIRSDDIGAYYEYMNMYHIDQKDTENLIE